MKTKISHISYYLPEKKLSNRALAINFPDADKTAVLQKLGIKNRHVIDPSKTASDLAVLAAEKLFSEHQIKPQSIAYVLFCAQEFDYYTPTTACIIQERLGIPTTAGALDFNLGCTGFLYGMSLAKGLIETQQVSNVLLLTSSSLTKELHKKSWDLRHIFGDGAAATLFTGSSEPNSHGKFVFGTDGSRFDKIILKDGLGRNPNSETTYNLKSDAFGNTYSDGHLYMDGISILNFTLETVPRLVKDTLKKNNLEKENIDLFIFHQPNEFILKQLQKKLKIPDEKFIIFIENTGNTISSTIPIALYEAQRQGKAKIGMKIMLIAFGVGLSWIGTVHEL